MTSQMDPMERAKEMVQAHYPDLTPEQEAPLVVSAFSAFLLAAKIDALCSAISQLSITLDT